MPNQIILGNSGSARECYWALREMLQDKISFKGFLSFEGHTSKLEDLSGFDIGSDDSYSPQPDDEFIIGIGAPYLRAKAYHKWKIRGIRFLTLIHPFSTTALTSMGEANVITCGCFFSCNTIVGNANYFNGGIALGHDAQIGNANFLGPNVFIAGSAIIGDENSFGVNSVVLANAKVGNRNIVSPGSFIYKGCKNDCRIHGNPAYIVS